MTVRIAASTALAWLAIATPSLAQDHADHHGHAAPAPATPAPDSADPHAGHGSAPTSRAAAASAGKGSMDAAEMDHGAMDHAVPHHDALHHDEAGAGASFDPAIETPPPPEAGSGPPRAADAIWGADAMRASRRQLQSHGAFPLFWFQVDRAELQLRDGRNAFLWNAQGYYGGPVSRLWFKSEGAGDFADGIEEAEIQALYSRAITPFFDLQMGVRHDPGQVDTTHAVIGLQGLAPYEFEIDAALFLSHRGDLTAKIEAELDQRITQRLILQPRAELSLAAQDVPRLGIGAGIDRIRLGLHVRYEIIREIAPYIGVEQSWRTGSSAELARAAGEDPHDTSLVAGIRFWF